MATKNPPRNHRPRISADRAGRLYKLLRLVSRGPVARETLLRRLKIGMRTFYRDVDLLRAGGAAVEVQPKGYVLEGKLEDALDTLPFPDPELTFGEVESLVKGRTKAHQRLRKLFEKVTK